MVKRLANNGKAVTAEILEFRKPQEYTTGECRCLACSHRWVGVVPVGTNSLECPNYQRDRGIRADEVVRAEYPIWVCVCGNDMMHLTSHGSYCVACGAWANL